MYNQWFGPDPFTISHLVVHSFVFSCNVALTNIFRHFPPLSLFLSIELMLQFQFNVCQRKIYHFHQWLFFFFFWFLFNLLYFCFSFSFYFHHCLWLFVVVVGWTIVTHFFRPLTSYNKRESCASSATTTTLLGPPPGNYLSQRGSNGALHLYSMPRAISPLMQVN